MKTCHIVNFFNYNSVHSHYLGGF